MYQTARPEARHKAEHKTPTVRSWVFYKKIEEVSGQEIPQKCRKDLKQIVSGNAISSEMIKVFKRI